MPTLDLGCGGQKRGDIGVDIAPWPGVDYVVKLGFEALPFPDNHFDHAYCFHAIEHIPFMVYYREDRAWHRWYPMVQFLKEVFRVLKPGAAFEIVTLSVKQPNGGTDFRMWQDPTHVSVWMPETMQHFCGKRDSAAGNANDAFAGLHIPFIPEQNGLNSDNLLSIVLRKP